MSQDAPAAFYYLGLTRRRAGRAEEAAQFWQRALALRENFPEVNFALGGRACGGSAATRARPSSTSAGAQDASKLVYRVRLGGVLMLLLRYDRALEVSEEAAARFPASAETQYFVGIAARGRGDYETRGGGAAQVARV